MKRLLLQRNISKSLLSASMLVLSCGGGDSGGDPGDVTAPTGGDFSVSATAAESIVLALTAASDDYTAAENIQYSVYYSSTEDLSVDVATIENSAIPSGGWQTNIGSHTIEGLETGTSYNINVIVRDETGNKAILTQQSATTGSSPSVGGSGALASVNSTGNITVSWSKASSSTVSASSLSYRLYTSSSPNLRTLEDVLANGTAQGDWSADIASITLSNLSTSTRYYYNLVVQDTQGNMSVYNDSYFDTDAEIHLAYVNETSREVKYINYIDGAWQAAQVVSGSDSSYRYNISMELDSSNSPYICYYNETDTSLKLATTDGSTFSQQLVATTGTPGQYCSIGFDSSGDPAISAYDGSDRDLYYYFQYSGVWSLQVAVSTTDYDGLYNHMKIDDNGASL